MIKYLFYIIIFSLVGIHATKGQEQFRTIVPKEPVIVGESFQVQFVIGSENQINNIIPPSFRGFKFVSGPSAYSGSVIENGQLKKYQNIVFTLTAVKKGKFRIGGAVVFINGKAIRSNDESVNVISRSDAALLLQESSLSSEYFLHSDEDPMEKIQRNLFLKVLVNRNSCYVGEPIVATFKLYSRLQSRSEILKNPGFYGFGVYDIVSLNDRLQTIEMINGRAFDVHTIRKVQLYPFQSGTYSIDPMELHNEIEFSRSSVNIKLDQQITEGFKNNVPGEKKEGVEVFETNLKTAPVFITVKPLPEKNKPADFNGAVGEFKINAVVKNKTLQTNQQSVLEVSISGKGNFPQINPPAVQWPVNFETFEMHLADSFSRIQVPLSGKRSFTFPIVVSKANSYIIPPIRFSYFNPVSKKYNSLETSSLRLEVTPSPIRSNEAAKNKIVTLPVKSNSWYITAGIIAFFIFFLLFLGSFFYKKKIKLTESRPVLVQSQTIEKRLLSLRPLLTGNDRQFYIQLKQNIWDFCREYFPLTGSKQDRSVLSLKLKEAGIAPSTIISLIEILDQCEMYIYNEIESTGEKVNMFDKAQRILNDIDNSLNPERIQI